MAKEQTPLILGRFTHPPVPNGMAAVKSFYNL
jgi:hypothetical protein